MQYIAMFAFCALVVSCPFSAAKSKTSQTHSNWLYSSILAFCPMSMLHVLNWLFKYFGLLFYVNAACALTVYPVPWARCHRDAAADHPQSCHAVPVCSPLLPQTEPAAVPAHTQLPGGLARLSFPGTGLLSSASLASFLPVLCLSFLLCL